MASFEELLAAGRVTPNDGAKLAYENPLVERLASERPSMAELGRRQTEHGGDGSKKGAGTGRVTRQPGGTRPPARPLAAKAAGCSIPSCSERGTSVRRECPESEGRIGG